MQAPGPSNHSAAIVHKFREQQHNPTGPATPPRPTQAPPRAPSVGAPIAEDSEEEEEERPSSSAATREYAVEQAQAEETAGPSSAASASSDPHDSPGLQTVTEEQEVGVPVKTTLPEQVTTFTAVPPSFPPRSASANSMTSPRVLGRMDSRSSTESMGSNNLAMAQSKEQSRQLLEKASQKLASLLVNANDKNYDATRRPGEAAVRRAPQVGATCLANNSNNHNSGNHVNTSISGNAKLNQGCGNV